MEGWGGMRGREITLYVDDSEASRRLVKEIASRGGDIRVIDVDERRLRGWLLLEYGTYRVPLMVTPEGEVLGPQEALERLRRGGSP